MPESHVKENTGHKSKNMRTKFICCMKDMLKSSFLTEETKVQKEKDWAPGLPAHEQPFGCLFRAWGFKGEGESYHWTIRKSFCRMNLELSLREGSRFLKAEMEQGMANGSTVEGRCLATSGESVTMGMSPVQWMAFHCLRL